MEIVNPRHPRSSLLIPVLPFLLCLLLQIACASSVPPTRTPESSVDVPPPNENSSQTTELHDATMILLREHPLSAIEMVDIAHGERQLWPLTQTGDVRALLANPHLHFAGWLIDQDLRYYQLPAAVISPDGRWLIDEAEGLWLRQVDGGGERLLAETGNTPLWSPDSQFVAFRDGSGIRVANIHDERITPLNSTPDDIPLVWSPDSLSLLIQRDERLSIQALDGGQEQPLPLFANQLHGAPVWSRDGQTLFARYGSHQSMQIAGTQRVPTSLIAYDLANDSQRTIIAGRNGEGVLDFAISPDEASVAVWFATCRLTISQLVPIPVRSCTHELRVVLLDGSAERALTLATDTAQFTAPQIGWLDWQPPIELAFDSPLPQTPTTTAAQEAVASIEIPLIPLGERASEGTYHFRIQQVLTGSEALAYAEQTARTTHVPQPAPGYTQVAVLLEAQIDAGRINLSGRSIKAAGREGALYQAELLVGANGREGNNKQITLAALEGEQTLGFVFVVPTSETLQALYVHVPGADVEPFFLALHTEAAIQLPTAPPLPPNSLGVGEPAPVNTTVVAGDWEITFLPTAPEDETAAALQDQYVPTEGGYAVKVRMRYTGGGLAESTPNSCWEFQSAFRGLDGAVVVTVPYQVLPNFTTVQYLCLLPGGVAEGWLLVDAPSDVEPSIAVTPPSADRSEIRYFAVR